jgi:CO/xanthine dehydrogenase FAD-binding subunit
VRQPLYLRPAGLEEALAALSGQALVVLAGGTDFYPARVGRPLREDVLDITRLAALRGIGREDGMWRIGALTTWTDILREPLPAVFDGLKRAAREVGGMQVQNTGTLGGNICNASPAADGVPCLLALDAEVELASACGRRRVPLGGFVTGGRQTARRPDELVTSLLIPGPGARCRSTFLKLGARRYLVISIVMVAVTVDVDESGTVVKAAVAVGACSPVAQRLPALEARLVGRPLAQAASLVRPIDLAALTPIDDVRGTAAYRMDATERLIQRALRGLADE